MKKKNRVEFNHKTAVILSGILGAIVFLLIYGPYSLNVCDDSWILHQYDGPDIIQNYAGWTQFRISDWAYPLGYANQMAYGDGTYITYTDSIPYLAIFFKLFRGMLPQTFQYFGWFTLGCFVLQGIGACLLIKRKYPGYSRILIGEVFFLTAPILIERVFKHTALGAQWFILFALYYYLEYRAGEKGTKLPWQLILLAGLTVGIHPYFLPMVMIFVALVMAEAFLKKYTLWKIAGYGAISLVVSYGLGVVIGALGTDIESTTRSGYGIFGLNLNALFNPRSYGGFTWSHVIEQRGQALQTYEGFNYIGLGILLGAAICAGVFVYNVCSDKESLKRVSFVLKRNLPLMAGMLFMTIFAISNRITWDYEVLLEIPLPDKLVEIASIFRSSGRMFFPVYYLLMLCVIYYLSGVKWKKAGVVLLGILLFVQVYDMRDVYVEKYTCMKKNYYRESIMDDITLQNIPDKVVLAVIGPENFELNRSLTIWAAAHEMGVAYSIANTGYYVNAEQFTQFLEGRMAEGEIHPQVMYVATSEEVMQNWREALAGKEYIEYKRGFYYFVYIESSDVE